MRRECRERFSRHWLQRKPLVIDPGMPGSLTAVAGKTFTSFPVHARPAILRMWQEAHGVPFFIYLCDSCDDFLTVELYAILYYIGPKCIEPRYPYLTISKTVLHWTKNIESMTPSLICNLLTIKNTTIRVYRRNNWPHLMHHAKQQRGIYHMSPYAPRKTAVPNYADANCAHCLCMWLKTNA